jgi:hypothetical protein
VAGATPHTGAMSVEPVKSTTKKKTIRSRKDKPDKVGGVKGEEKSRHSRIESMSSSLVEVKRKKPRLCTCLTAPWACPQMLHVQVERLEQELKRKETEVHAEDNAKISPDAKAPPVTPPPAERRQHMTPLATPDTSAAKLPVVAEVRFLGVVRVSYACASSYGALQPRRSAPRLTPRSMDRSG